MLNYKDLKENFVYPETKEVEFKQGSIDIVELEVRDNSIPTQDPTVRRANEFEYTVTVTNADDEVLAQRTYVYQGEVNRFDVDSRIKFENNSSDNTITVSVSVFNKTSGKQVNSGNIAFQVIINPGNSESSKVNSRTTKKTRWSK